MDAMYLHGGCRPGSVVRGERYRFTLLTSRLVRIEYAQDGVFEDRPSQMAVNRDFDVPSFNVRDTAAGLEIHTEHLSIFYDKGPLTPGGLSIKVRSACRGIYSTWRYGEALTENLGGTARTLDQADGAVTLEPGVQSRLQGYSVLDDSASMLLREDGWVEPRKEGATDLYFFGYGYAYQECIRDFFRLSGSSPLLPRYALGNWWSRFHPYSAEDYGALMDHFAEEAIPLSVAVLDMDWHITDVDPRDGKGWTGYTWNRTLIPRPAEFLDSLHGRGLKVTLNLHPAEGIQPHEEQYPAAARALGREAERREPISFDFCDPDFVRVYFQHLLRPLERDGVDFWWIDWQQGEAARLPGADPLWLLNHFHFLASASGGRRPMIFSRYAGPGSHRYPVGFSGDSVISWASLDFQPFFTATAANIGYGWWSHDIGGHCGGKRDEELLVRWVQFGVFSPIMRLHSTSNLFNGKEPWKFGEPAYGILKRFLRLRHQLVPYLYTLNRRCSQEGVLPVRPMYYDSPDRDAAYEVPNQYAFGEELLVCPITAPTDPELGLGHTVAWLPGRLYFDFFTGLRYHGCRKLNLYRPLDSLPVLAPAGAIVPLTAEEEAARNGTALPAHMDVRIFGGRSGSFELYEDDGESMEYQDGASAITRYEFHWGGIENASFQIVPGHDPAGVRPRQRQHTLAFIGVSDMDGIEVEAGGEPAPFSKKYDPARNALILDLPLLDSADEVAVRFPGALALAKNAVDRRIFELLNGMRIDYELKERIYRCISCNNGADYAFCELQTMGLAPGILNAIAEILFAQ